MGDSRFDEAYAFALAAREGRKSMDDFAYEDLVHALAGASRQNDPLLANVLATELLNRYRRRVPFAIAVIVGGVVGIALGLLALTALAAFPHNFPDEWLLAAMIAGLLAGALVGMASHRPLRRGLLTRRRA